MPGSKRYRPEYLSFTKKERTGIITIVILIILCIVVPFFFPLFIGQGQVDQTEFEKEIAALDIKQRSGADQHEKRNEDEQPYASIEGSSQHNVALFYFDPNTLPVEGWKKLGIKERTALTIQKYISKGGRFKKPEDISKIWGLQEDEVRRLLPYVKIAAEAIDRPAFSRQEFEKRSFARPSFEVRPVDINAADTAAFIALPGIGSKLASRIVAFREKLGGFYKIEQVAETYGLADSVFQKIRNRLVLHAGNIKKLNINSGTVDEMKEHPYLRYNLANAIVQYRLQHGRFENLSDLKHIMAFNQDTYEKVLPYLSL